MKHLFILIVFAGAVLAQPSSSSPIRKVSSLPATCTAGTTNPVVHGGTVKYCSATNTWTAFGSGGGTLSGTLTSPRIPYASGATTLVDSANLQWDNTNQALGIGGAPSFNFDLRGTTIGGAHFAVRPGTMVSGDILYYGLTPTVTGNINITNIGGAISGTAAAIFKNTNTASGTADMAFQITTGGASGGDPFLYFAVTGANDFFLGMDNSDSDKFKIGTGSTPSSGTAAITVDTSRNVAVATSLAVGSSGVAVTSILAGSASLDFGATAAGTCDSLTITVTGAADGDEVFLGIPNALATADTYQSFEGFVSSSNTVTVKRCNLTNATTALSNPAAATVKAIVFKH